ncbi:hypothetical protein D9613_007564 [Agrocybe pediades]|uniref:Uncharacterized protein n=1 Tax=Agrocybe pediades TaxID=84607 RepID=A0A8H4QMA1_9AGAR|nr:hypothetical protein D9613_007564 [Agrocybe pediades]
MSVAGMRLRSQTAPYDAHAGILSSSTNYSSSMYGGYSSPPLTNNPFIADTATGSASSRFPDLSSPPHPQQQQQYGSQGQGWGGGSVMGAGTPGGYPQQQQGLYQQQQQYQSGYGQPQQQMGMSAGMGMGGGDMGSGYMATGSYPQGQQQQTGASHFQPTSSFGQQLAAQVPISGSSYSYLQGGQQQQQQPQNASYNPAQQQLQNNPGYVAQFDPYGPIAQGWDGSHNAQQQHQQQQQQQFGTPGMLQQSTSYTGVPSSAGFQGSYGNSPAGDPHPRDYIRAHKAQVEAWDSYAWKQFLHSFEALMKAWEARKSELAQRLEQLKAEMNRGLGYGDATYVGQVQMEGSRITALQKEAEENFDSVAASTFQMREVFQGYRQSSDLASKSRVREATNAALHGLPGWPQPY